MAMKKSVRLRLRQMPDRWRLEETCLAFFRASFFYNRLNVGILGGIHSCSMHLFMLVLLKLPLNKQMRRTLGHHLSLLNPWIHIAWLIAWGRYYFCGLDFHQAWYLCLRIQIEHGKPTLSSLPQEVKIAGQIAAGLVLGQTPAKPSNMSNSDMIVRVLWRFVKHQNTRRYPEHQIWAMENDARICLPGTTSETNLSDSLGTVAKIACTICIYNIYKYIIHCVYIYILYCI